MTQRPDALDRLGEFFSARAVKIPLALLIILSLLPIGALEDHLRPLFLLAFGIELAVRLALLYTRRTRRTVGELFFTAVDLAAFVSFLPLHAWFDMHLEFLNLLRLTRLLVLLRFARALAHDVYTIMTRREQLQQFQLVTAAVIFLAFVSAVLVDQLRIPHDYDEDEQVGGEAFVDKLWWAFRQLESADNLVRNTRPPGEIVVLSLLLTIQGVFIISFIIGLGANVVAQVLRAERRRPVGYRNHVVIVGPVQDHEILVREFVRIYDKHRPLRRVKLREVVAWIRGMGPAPRRHGLLRMALLGPSIEPPHYIYEPMMRHVLYRHGDGAERMGLDRVAASAAKRVVLLAQPGAGLDADAITISRLAAFRAVNRVAHAFVELQQSDNAAIVHAVGGTGTFPLDVPRILGLFLCQHLIVPGVEALYRDLLTAGGSEFYTHIYIDRGELEALVRLGDRHLSFAEMARCAYFDHGVLLTGVFLAEAVRYRSTSDLVPLEGLVRWVNPEVMPEDEPRVAALGGRPGLVPARTLRGLIGICSTYVPLREYARRLASGGGLMLEAEMSRADTMRPGAPTHDPHDDLHAESHPGASSTGRRQVRRKYAIGTDPGPDPLTDLEAAEEGRILAEMHEAPAGFEGAPAGMVGAAPGATGQAAAEPAPIGLLQRTALEVAASLRLDDGHLRRVLIVGFSPALRSLLIEIARFVPHIEVAIVVGVGEGAGGGVGARLESLGLGIDRHEPLPGGAGRRVPLERNGHAVIYTHESGDIADFAGHCLARAGAVDAAVFLSEPDAEDRDARTALRLLRFAHALELGRAPKGERLHLLAEFVSLDKGERIQAHLNARKCGFQLESQLKLTFVSTDQIKNYFMVHSAFVPGVTSLYEELLSEAGQEIVRLELPIQRRPVGGQVTLSTLIDALRPHHCLPIALELVYGKVVLNPAADRAFPVEGIAAVYAIADARRLPMGLGGERRPRQAPAFDPYHPPS